MASRPMGIRLVVTRENLDQSRLATPVLTDQRAYLAGAEGERDVGQRPLATEGFGEVRNLKRLDHQHLT